MPSLPQGVAGYIDFGPFLDSGDGLTPLPGVAASIAPMLSKDGADAVARSSAVAITHDQGGFFKVHLDEDDLDTLGILRVSAINPLWVPVWQDYQVITLAEYQQEVGSTTYTTVSEIRNYKVNGRKIRDLIKYTDAEIVTKILLTAQQIESICGDIFYPLEQTYYFDGSGDVKQYFVPKISQPLVSVESVVEVDTDGTTELNEWTQDEDFKLYPYYLETCQYYDDESPRRRFGRGGTWPRGQQNIKITGTWGRSSTPMEIQEAARLLTLERLIPGSTQMGARDVKQAVWNDFTITFRGGDNFGAASGFEEVDRLLRNHINYAPMFQAVPDKPGLHDRGLSSFFRI